MKMNKLLWLVAGIVVMLACNSCDKDEELQLRFSVENNSSPENLRVEYSSPDPSCLPMSYQIIANSCESEVTLRCTNADSITIEGYGFSGDDFTCTTGGWNARVVDGSAVTIFFDEIALNQYEEIGADYSRLNLVGQTKKGPVTARVIVCRYINSIYPVN